MPGLAGIRRRLRATSTDPSAVEEDFPSVSYSRYDAEDFEILQKIGEIKFGEDAPTTVFVGGGSSIRLYAAKLSPKQARYQPGGQRSEVLCLREHTAAAANIGRREWAAYTHLGADDFSPGPTNSEPENFLPILGAFVTQTMDPIRDTDTSVWTITRLQDLNKDAISLGLEARRLSLSLEEISRILRQISNGATQALLRIHEGGLAHGGIDSSSVVILEGDMSTKKERKMITSGLSNLGYTAKLTAKNSNDAYPFLASHTLAAAAGRRGLEKDTALAASVARREDMRRLGVALLEIALCASGVNTLDWLSQEGRTPSSIGSVVKLGDGGEGIRRIKNSAENARLTVSDVLGEDGWKFLGILAGMEEEDNPFLKLSMATRHPYVKY